MKRYVLVFLLIAIPFLVSAQNNASNIVVGEVGEEEITYSELKNHMSNNTDENPTLQEMEDFLPVYLDYRAKLLAAKNQGYYEKPEILEEHQNYARQAAYSKWLQGKIKPEAFDEFVERANYELKTYHILIAANQQTTPEEIENIKEKLAQARKEIENGTPLGEVNEKYSTVRNGRHMGGDIPWISAGKTIPEYEDVAYSLEVGEISEPFRSQFGYHIVLLQDKRETTPARRTSHIFVRSTNDNQAYDKIQEAYQSLENGDSWLQAVRQYSEDGNSVRRQGLIGWVNYQSNFASDFVDVIYSVDPENEYSEPLQTNYGYHIFKIDSVRTYDTEEQRINALRSRFEDSPYYKENNDFAADYLLEHYSSKTHDEILDAFVDFLNQQPDSLRFEDLKLSQSDLEGETIFEFRGNSYSVNDFNTYLAENYQRRPANSYSDNWFTFYTRNIVDEQIISLTEAEFPEFKEQSQGYLDGLVVYQINDDHIWSAATVDTSRLRNIYKNNMEDYTYPKRPYYHIITARADSLLLTAKDFITSGMEPDSLPGYIKGIRVSSDSSNTYTDEPFNRLQDLDEGEFSEIFEYNKRKAIFLLNERLPSRPMTFEEAFDRVFSHHQPTREQEWLNALRNKYGVKAYPDALQNAYRKDS